MAHLKTLRLKGTSSPEEFPNKCILQNDFASTPTLDELSLFQGWYVLRMISIFWSEMQKLLLKRLGLCKGSPHLNKDYVVTIFFQIPNDQSKRSDYKVKWHLVTSSRKYSHRIDWVWDLFPLRHYDVLPADIQMILWIYLPSNRGNESSRGIPYQKLGGGFKCLLFSPLFGEDSHLD